MPPRPSLSADKTDLSGARAKPPPEPIFSLPEDKALFPIKERYKQYTTVAIIQTVRGFTPKIGKGCFLAANAVIVGDVTIGEECSIWFSTVLRGDVNTITIGDRVNIQDGSVLHTLYEKSTIEIGNDVSIGHNVTIHGAKIHDLALIGMGAVVMDDAEVGEGALVAAGSVVLSRTKIGSHEMWAGAPAKFVKMVEPEKAREMNQKIARNYLMYSTWYDPAENPGAPEQFQA